MKPEFIHRDGMTASNDYVQWLSDIKHHNEQVANWHQVGGELGDSKLHQLGAEILFERTDLCNSVTYIGK